MDLRQKLEYIWDYYKIPLLGVPCALLLIFYAVLILSADTEPVLSVYLINQPVTEDARAVFAEELHTSLFPSEADSILVDASLTITPSAPDHESQLVFTTAVAGHTVDIMIADPEFFTYYAQRDAFADLTKLLPEDRLETLAPYLLWAESPDGSPCAYGIDISGFAAFSSLSLDAPILSVAKMTEHNDAVLTFLRGYLFPM